MQNFPDARSTDITAIFLVSLKKHQGYPQIDCRQCDFNILRVLGALHKLMH